MHNAYHLDELEIALDTAHSSHILPPAIPPERRVLDIGCGIGQTLIAKYSDRISFGLDVDLDALKSGRARADTSNICFVCGKAEALPWRNAEFDFVIARESLIYTDLSASLREIHRVLKKDGQLWITLQTAAIVWKAAAKAGSIKGWIRLRYIMLNSTCFHLVQGRLRILSDGARVFSIIEAARFWKGVHRAWKAFRRDGY